MDKIQSPIDIFLLNQHFRSFPLFFAKRLQALDYSIEFFCIYVSALNGPTFLRQYYRDAKLYPFLKEVNRRRENVATDEMLRTGKQTRPRRSEFLEW